GWDVALEGSAPLHADAVVVATGGLSVPNTGSDGTGLGILERLGHVVHPTYAALTPLTADGPADATADGPADGTADRTPFAGLAGISLRVALTARADGRAASASGGFLFTHRGYSGPSVLDVSHVVVRSRAHGAALPARLTVRWTPHDDAAWESLLRPQGGRAVASVVRAELPDRLAAALLGAAGVDAARPLADLTRAERRRLVEALVRGELPWSGDEGYKKAEVTGGGVRLSDVDPRTMESRVRPGLYLCGEVLDAFGPIGGYNFLWAWATGRAAGRAAGRVAASSGGE
ncbi:MAG: NAD(FAD)-utilizing dehydrogenases, partial [uncultured Gemmatimonadaceae bacterium]